MEKYLIFSLCDNDFGWRISNAVKELTSDRGLNFCPCVAKDYVINHVCEASEKYDQIYIGSIREYLSEKLLVYRSNNLPTYDLDKMNLVDDDGGSVYLDTESMDIRQF